MYQKFVSGKDGPVRTADEDQLKILDEVPSSAVEMQVKDKVDFSNPILFLCMTLASFASF